jgi:hypothetical protein
VNRGRAPNHHQKEMITSANRLISLNLKGVLRSVLTSIGTLEQGNQVSLNWAVWANIEASRRKTTESKPIGSCLPNNEQLLLLLLHDNVSNLYID